MIIIVYPFLEKYLAKTVCELIFNSTADYAFSQIKAILHKAVEKTDVK